MGRNSLITLAHSLACKYRCIDRLVTENPQLAEVENIEELIQKGELSRIKQALYQKRGLTMYELKIEAQRLCIKNYSRLTRSELEGAIKNATKSTE